MSVLNISSKSIPPSLAGPTLISGKAKTPRYWTMVWLSLDAAHLSPSKLRQKLSAIESLYCHFENNSAFDLDYVLAELNIAALREGVTPYYLQLRNSAIARNVDPYPKWKHVSGFLLDILSWLTRPGLQANASQKLEADVRNLERKLQNLNPNLSGGRHQFSVLYQLRLLPNYVT